MFDILDRAISFDVTDFRNYATNKTISAPPVLCYYALIL